MSGGNWASTPAGASSCGAWEHAADVSDPEGLNDLGTVNIDDDGVVWNLLTRECDNGDREYLWVPEIDGEDLATLAFDEVSRRVAAPSVTVSPSLETSGYVHIESWLAVEPLDDVAATAGPLPSGLSATTTATVTSIEWATGDPEVGTIECPPWGGLPPPGADEDGLSAPCGWTPTYPSTPEFGVDGGAFEGSVTLVWSVSWTSTDGDGGDLGTLTTTTPVSYRVREIQTVGVSG